MMTSVGTRTLNQLKNIFLASRKRQDLNKLNCKQFNKSLVQDNIRTFSNSFLNIVLPKLKFETQFSKYIHTQSNPSLMMTPIQKMF